MAVAGGFVAAFYALGLAPLRWQEGWPWLALAAALVGGFSVPTPVSVVAWIGVAARVAWRVVPPSLFNDEAWQGTRVPCYAAVAGSVLLLGLTPTPARRLAAFGWALAAAGGAILLHSAGNALFAEMTAALAAILVVVGLIARNADGAIAVAAVLHPAILAAGCFNNYSDVPTWAFAAIALAPLTAHFSFSRSRGL